MTDIQIEPGKPLTSAEKAALAKDNERESKEAQQRAAEQIEQDRINGQRPVTSEVADSIRKKLENEEFQSRE